MKLFSIVELSLGYEILLRAGLGKVWVRQFAPWFGQKNIYNLKDWEPISNGSWRALLSTGFEEDEPIYLQGWREKNLSISRVGGRRTFPSTTLRGEESFYFQDWEEMIVQSRVKFFSNSRVWKYKFRTQKSIFYGMSLRNNLERGIPYTRRNILTSNPGSKFRGSNINFSPG